jgi:metallo-beta-lactamase family protein
MSVQILHHGAAEGVTGSCHQLILDTEHSLLVDCGLFQGGERSADEHNGEGSPEVRFDVSSVKALVATHVHIDHIGRLPWLLAAGFGGPILCSEASARLMPIVLEDAFRLGISRDAGMVRRYLRLLDQRIVALPYKRWYPLVDTPRWLLKVRLQRAGHILGSAFVECEVLDRSSGSRRRVVFSGDLGATHTPLLPAPRSPYAADVLVLESTYGDRNHESRANRRRRLQAVVERALRDRGTVLIPAFSIGRTQELLYEFEDILHRNRARADGPWSDLPVILDSPLASRFTDVYRELHPFWDAEARQRLSRGRQALDFPALRTVDTHAAHLRMVRDLATSARPAIVIAAGGMCSGGRIVNYLRAMLGDKRHNVLFVGYQARGTPGRVIQRYGPQGGYVEFDGERIDIRAGIETVAGYSAHADQRGLLSFVTGMRRWPSEIRVVHGDAEARSALADVLQSRYSARGLPVRILGGSA